MAGGHEVVAQRVHRQQRGHPGHVAEIVGEGRPWSWSGRRSVRPAMMSICGAVDLVADEREGEPGEVAAAAGAADDDVRVSLADLRELLLGLQADDGLVQQHVVEHAAQGVAGVPVGSVTASSTASLMAMPRLPGVSGILGEDRRGRPASRCSGWRRTRPPQVCIMSLRNGFWSKLHAHHVDLALQPELSAGKGERAAPLAGAGLGGQALDAELLVVVGLRRRRYWACGCRPG